MLISYVSFSLFHPCYTQRARQASNKSHYLRQKRKRARVGRFPLQADTSVNTIPSSGSSTSPRMFTDPATALCLLTTGSAATFQLYSSSRTPAPAANTSTHMNIKPATSAQQQSHTASTGEKTPRSSPLSSCSAIDKQQPEPPISFSALSENDYLDTRVYHRGIAGQELRDDTTGDLLCDVEATDTGKATGPIRAVPVTVQFTIPMDNGEDDKDLQATGEEQLLQQPYVYKEIISWDISQSSTLTPHQYATDVAVEYGLSFTQTMDLTASIQRQLAATLSMEHIPPVSLEFQSVALPNEKPQPITPVLYGSFTGETSSIEGQWRTGKTTGNIPRPWYERIGVLRPPVPTGTIEKKPSFAGSTGSGGSKRRKSTGGILPSDSASVDTSDADPYGNAAYRNEVKNRLKAACMKEVAGLWKKYGSESAAPGTVELLEMGICHHCKKTGPCAVFVCRHYWEGVGTATDGKSSSSTHMYCFQHLQDYMEKYEVRAQTPLVIPFCPICSLTCSCKPCSNRLQTLCSSFKMASHSQGDVSPKLTRMDQLYQRCTLAVTKAELGRASTMVGACAVSNNGPVVKPNLIWNRPVAPKVPISEFPREIFKGVDIDPGNETTYAAIFTRDGSFIEQTSPPPSGAGGDGSGRQGVVEDGSVDYCNVCKSCGDLLCCDTCPRAYHSRCIPKESQDESSETWKCPACVEERSGGTVEKDQLNGSKYYETIFAAAEDIYNEQTEDDLLSIRVLSMVYEMLLILMDYDFGLLFRSPVDPKEVPAYPRIVKEPMDLGTIAFNIINGKYFSRCKDLQPEKVFQQAILLVLKDVELVWHNCFVFNCEGSAVYRMAEVQQRKATNIRNKSFDHLLSDSLKEEVVAYRETCQQRRNTRTFSGTTSAQPRSPTSAAVSKRKIAATTMGTKGRRVAVLDPDTGKIVKMYASAQTAWSVVDLFAKLQFQCEWDTEELDQANKVRRIISDSAINYKIRLFGYRWLPYQMLESNKVAFPTAEEEAIAKQEAAFSLEQQQKATEVAEAAPRQLVELKISGEVLVFSSIKEAFDHVVSTASAIPLPSLNAFQVQIRAADKSVFTEICGVGWRLLDLGLQLTDLKGIAVIKREGGRSMTAFRSMQGAYNDWRRLATENGIDGLDVNIFSKKMREGSTFSIGSNTWAMLSEQSSNLDQTTDSNGVKQNGVSSAVPREPGIMESSTSDIAVV